MSNKKSQHPIKEMLARWKENGIDWVTVLCGIMSIVISLIVIVMQF